jgi:hypothetical protein
MWNGRSNVDSATNVPKVKVFYLKVPSTYYDVVLEIFLFSCYESIVENSTVAGNKN